MPPALPPSPHLGLAPYLRTIRRFGDLAQFIDAHLDDTLNLAQLSDLSQLSASRLVREFHAYANEPLMSRVWRLRLLRAAQQIAAQPERPLLDVALDAGYNSAAAFTRAFRRQRAQPPSACRQPPAEVPSLRFETLPALAVQCLPYAGIKAEFRLAAHELRARAMALGIERHRRFGWQIDVESMLAGQADTPVAVHTALLHAPLGCGIPGLDQDCLPGGHYAVFSLRGKTRCPPTAQLAARIREQGWQLQAGPWLRRCRNTEYLPSYLESRFELYLPVRPDTAIPATAPQAFILEK